MSLDYINAVLEQYSVEHASSFEELPQTTSRNTSYRVTTPSCEYVLRQLVRQSVAGATEELYIQTELNAHGIKTPLYLNTNSGGVAVTEGASHFVLSKLLPGSRQPEDTIELAKDMGATLARIHNALPDLRITFNRQQWFNYDNALYQLKQYDGPDKEFISAQTAIYSSILNKDLPRTLTHGDFHTNNIFSADDKVTAVFDFESAEHTVRILDIARLYLTYVKVTDLNPKAILRAITEGYNSKASTPLQEKEYGEMENAFIYVALVSSVSIANRGNSFSSAKYVEIAKNLIAQQEAKA